MRQAVVLVLAMLAFSMAIMGCVKPDPDIDSPVGSIPKILVDHVGNRTKIYIRGLDDHRYDTMQVRAFKGNDMFVNVTDEDVFMQQVTLERAEFTLNITVQDKKKVYGFEGNFTVDPPNDPKTVFLISTLTESGDIKERKVEQGDLPWRTLADRIE